MDRSWQRLAIWLAVVAAAIWVFGRLSTLVGMAIAVLIITFPIFPLVDWLERRTRLGRGAAAALVLLGVVVAMVIALAVVIPWIAGQAQVVIGIAPKGVEAVRTLFNALQTRMAEPTFPDLLRTAWDRAGEAAVTAANNMVRHAVNLAVGVFSQLYLLLLLPFVIYFVLLDYPQSRASVLALIPEPTRGRLDRLLAKLTITLRWGLWAQVVVSSIVGALTAIGLAIVDVPGPVAIGAFAAVAEAIPYIGGFATYVVVLIAAAPQGGSAWAWGMVVVTIVKLLSNVIVPLVLGRMTHTHPLAIIVALLVLGQLFGLIGMFFAIPAVVIVREILAWWRPGGWA
jgi:predicted PurR-regulated permease PerM